MIGWVNALNDSLGFKQLKVLLNFAVFPFFLFFEGKRFSKKFCSIQFD